MTDFATPDDLANTVDPPKDKVLSPAGLIEWLRTNSEARAEICRIIRVEFFEETNR